MEHGRIQPAEVYEANRESDVLNIAPPNVIESKINEAAKHMSPEALAPEATTFRHLENFIGVVPAEDGRYHIEGFKPKLLSIALEGYKTPEEINDLYERMLPHWGRLESVDYPDTQEAMLSRIRSEINATEEVKNRLLILDELGVDAGMAAHSERTGYNGALFTALYIIANKDPENLEPADDGAEKIEQALNTHKFTRQELQLIALGGLCGLLHDIGKAEKYDELWEYQDILLSIEKLSDEQFKRMKMHTRDGAKTISELGFPKIIASVAERHHNYKDFTPNDISIYDDPTNIMVAMITWLDQLDTATSTRRYQSAKLMAAMHTDRYILEQQNMYDSNPAKVAYHQLVTLNDKMIGNKFKIIEARALAKKQVQIAA